MSIAGDTSTDLSDLNYRQLQAVCRQHGLSPAGKKVDLQRRLVHSGVGFSPINEENGGRHSPGREQTAADSYSEISDPSDGEAADSNRQQLDNQDDLSQEEFDEGGPAPDHHNDDDDDDDDDDLEEEQPVHTSSRSPARGPTIVVPALKRRTRRLGQNVGYALLGLEFAIFLIFILSGTQLRWNETNKHLEIGKELNSIQTGAELFARTFTEKALTMKFWTSVVEYLSLLVALPYLVSELLNMDSPQLTMFGFFLLRWCIGYMFGDWPFMKPVFDYLPLRLFNVTCGVTILYIFWDHFKISTRKNHHHH